MNIAIFGGSFNPPHVAHVLACALLLSVEDVERVLVVPALKHAFAKPLAPFADRVRMCELAMGWLPRVDVSRVEGDIGGESRTLRTLEHLAKVHPEWRMRLVVGADVLADAPRWLGFDAVMKLAPPIVLGRAGVDEPAAGKPLLPDISSTRVRDAAERGAWGEIEQLVPRPVLSFVRDRGLYRASA